MVSKSEKSKFRLTALLLETRRTHPGRPPHGPTPLFEALAARADLHDFFPEEAKTTDAAVLRENNGPNETRRGLMNASELVFQVSSTFYRSRLQEPSRTATVEPKYPSSCKKGFDIQPLIKLRRNKNKARRNVSCFCCMVQKVLRPDGGGAGGTGCVHIMHGRVLINTIGPRVRQR